MTAQHPSPEERREPRIILKPITRGEKDIPSQSGNSNRVLPLLGLGMVLLFLFGCIYLFRDEISGKLSGQSNESLSEATSAIDGKTPFIAKSARETILVEYIRDQDQRELEAVLAHWAPTVKRYYNLFSPDHGELETKFLRMWDKVNYSKNTVIGMREIGTSRIEVDVEFEFQNKNGKRVKNITSTVAFEFDEQNRLVSETSR